MATSFGSRTGITAILEVEFGIPLLRWLILRTHNVEPRRWDKEREADTGLQTQMDQTESQRRICDFAPSSPSLTPLPY